MKRFIFATHNENKVQEVLKFLPQDLEVLSLADIGCEEEVPETQATIEGNAIQKAKYVYHKYLVNCFADDTGLLVDSLNGKPGVLSARYAGIEKDPEANIYKLLNELEGKKNRKAHFKTIIALNVEGEIYKFVGICEGIIAQQKIGIGGFGYDPVFIPNGHSKTFAEMTIEEKNKIGHRGKAVRALTEYLITRFLK